REGVPMLMMRDDRYAVAVADAFSRITAGSRIGVCTFQGGVNAAGMQYAYAGMAQAYEDGSPVLCITDGVPAGSSGNSQYDVASAMKTVSKWFGYLDKPERTPELMRRAFTMLRSGRPGGPSAVRRRARRSGGTLPEQKRPHPRRRHEPVAGPLQPRHSRCGDEDHHPLQRRRAAHQQDVSDGARGHWRCALDLAGAPPGSVGPQFRCRTGGG